MLVEEREALFEELGVIFEAFAVTDSDVEDVVEAGGIEVWIFLSYSISESGILPRGRRPDDLLKVRRLEVWRFCACVLRAWLAAHWDSPFGRWSSPLERAR